MTEFYFNKFPIINYANTACRDITRRVSLEGTLRNIPYAFDKYTLQKSSRSDYVAYNYYDDPYMEWMIWLSNGIVDPYYDWYLTITDFDKFIEEKYGSIENSQKRVKYYQNNWYADDSELTPSFYDNTLAEKLRKYYTPMYGVNEKIISYKRQKDDTIKNTNKVLRFTSTNISNNFVLNEVVDILSGNTVVGGGEVVFSNTTVIDIKNISGNTSPTNVVKGETSNSTATISTTTTLYENIPDDEAVYFTPISYFEYELEKNEKNKNIRLMNPSYAYDVAEDFRRKIRE